MTRCGIEHPNVNTSCSRATGHKGDHKCNGLAWSHADVLAALRDLPAPPVQRLPECHQCGHAIAPADRRRLEGDKLFHDTCWFIWAAEISDPVNHPKHYTNHPSGVECIDVVRHMNFNRGNAIKYIWRAGEKGPPIEDLKKAAWYIADEIKRLERG